MEGLIKEELIKRRGYIATLEAGYRFFVDNFKTIFKHMWPYALAVDEMELHQIYQADPMAFAGCDTDFIHFRICLPDG